MSIRLRLDRTDPGLFGRHGEHRRLLDVAEGRSHNVLTGWLTERGPAWCEQITLATLNPATGKRAALIEHPAKATLVVDHFHFIKLANAAPSHD